MMTTTKCALAALAAAVLSVLSACAMAPPGPGNDVLRAQVFDAERNFAGTMARRDLSAFSAFISDEAVFFGAKGPARGKAAIVETWKRFFDPQQVAPFSWEPAQVEVLESGMLALSTGP